MAEYYYTNLILDKLDDEELPVSVEYRCDGIKVEILDIAPTILPVASFISDSLHKTYSLAIASFPFEDFMSMNEDKLYEDLSNEISAVKFLEEARKIVDKRK